jgi:hypothetical protein
MQGATRSDSMVARVSGLANTDVSVRLQGPPSRVPSGVSQGGASVLYSWRLRGAMEVKPNFCWKRRCGVCTHVHTFLLTQRDTHTHTHTTTDHLTVVNSVHGLRGGSDTPEPICPACCPILCSSTSCAAVCWLSREAMAERPKLCVHESATKKINNNGPCKSQPPIVSRAAHP